MHSLILKRPWTTDSLIASQAADLAYDSRIPHSIAEFLLKRGVDSSEDISRHFEPSLSMLDDPFYMSGMEEAVERLLLALSRSERIGIFGDYDADGVTSSSLLWLFLKEIGFEMSIYIPHREKEGYGLNCQGIDFLKSEGCSLLITVDTGITAFEEVNYASHSGMDVIVTDHHTPSGQTPIATAVINPKQSGCPFRFKEMAGVGVAFYLAWAFRNRLYRLGHWQNRPPLNLKSFLDLVALGTLADVVPVIGINRIFIKTGLEVLSNTVRPGSIALKRIAGVEGSVTVREASFRLTPLINAAGRMAHAMDAFKLLVADSETGAESLGGFLKSLNESRQKTQSQIHKSAVSMVKDLGPAPGYVLYNPEWHKGVVGITASKLADMTGRPVIMIAADGEFVCGSGRSPEGYNLVRMLQACEQYLVRFGGHCGAVGLTLDQKNLEEFKKAFIDMCLGSEDKKGVESSLSIDSVVSFKELSDPAYIEYLDMLEPFGPGYEAPVFVMRQFSVLNASVVGKNHLKLRITDDSKDSHQQESFDVLGWSHGGRLDLPWNRCEIAFEPAVNSWNGRRAIQFILKDARKRR